MKLAFIKTEIEPINPVVLSTTNGDNSLIYVAGLLLWLESNGAIITDKNWKTNHYQTLENNGIKVQFETVKFLFICKGYTFIIKRLSGNKIKFWGLCELFKATEY